MANIELQEISRRSITISKYEEVLTEWYKSYLTVRIDNSLRIFEFTHNLTCPDKHFDFIECYLNVPLTSPATDLLTFDTNNTKGTDLCQLVMDQGLWPHSKYIMKEMATIVNFKWSPENLLWNNKSILAVVNNVGQVEFYRKQIHTWYPVLDLSTYIKSHFESIINKRTKDLEHLKQVAYILQSSSICWGPSLNDDNSVHFVTAQKSGLILVWLLRENENNIVADILGEVKTDLNEIINLLWMDVDKKIYLMCSNIFGQIFILECAFNRGCVTVLNTIILWEHKDRMVIKNVTYTIRGNKILLSFSKHRHIILLMMDIKFKILDQYINNIDDQKVCGIQEQNGDFYAVTTNNLYTITVNINNESMDVILNPVKVKDMYPNSEVLGLTLSKTGTILSLAVLEQRNLHRKEPLKLHLILLYSDTGKSEIYRLLNNPSKKLTNYWDCLELLRYKAMKSRKLPAINYEELLRESETDVYKLKLCYAIAKIFDVLQTSFKITKNCLQWPSLELIKERIMAEHANSYMNNIHNKYISNGNTLDDIDVEFFMGCKTYLKYFNQKHKDTTQVHNNSMDVIDKEIIYVCQCCDEVLKDFSCSNEHVNLYCSLTFTPIESDVYLKCKGCGILARNELLSHNPMCIFCDLYLEDTNYSIE